MIGKTLLEAGEKMEKTVEIVHNEFSGIHSGRANAAVFNATLVGYYGTSTPLQQLGAIAIPEVRTVLITPLGRSAMASIDKTLCESDPGVSPTNDGNLIHVILPALTEKRRRGYVKLARSETEEARAAVRGIRRKARKALDKIERDGEADEDDVRRAEEELGGLTKHHAEQVDKVLEGKEKELLEV